MARGGAWTVVQITVVWQNQPNKEQVNNVENEDTPDDLVRGSGNLFPWVGSLGRGQSGEFGACV